MALGEMARAALAIAIGWLLGSVLPASLMARARGVDIRSVGDGNPGTVNAFRGLGPIAGVVTALYDGLVGVASIQIAYLLGAEQAVAYLAGIAAVAGHRFPVLRGFRRGGQGMAASAGLLLYGIGVALAQGWLSAMDVGALAGIAILTFAVTRSDRMMALVMLPVLAVRMLTSQADWQVAALVVSVSAYIWMVQLGEVRRVGWRGVRDERQRA